MKKGAEWIKLLGADDEARTRYLNLGKVALYQMSYIRIGAFGRNRTTDTGIFSPLLYRLSYKGILRSGTGSNRRPLAWQASVLTSWTTGPYDGNNRARTYDPLLVRQMLSQLSYAPVWSQETHFLSSFELLFCVSLDDFIIIPQRSSFVKHFFEFFPIFFLHPQKPHQIRCFCILYYARQSKKIPLLQKNYSCSENCSTGTPHFVRISTYPSNTSSLEKSASFSSWSDSSLSFV